MRFLVYNIAYGTGGPEGDYERLWKIHRYIKTSRSHLDRIIEFIGKNSPDIIGLVEVDTGSYRTNFVNQVELIASNLDHYQQSSIKYGRRSLGRAVPIMKKQANAILTKKEVTDSKFHFFPRGVKRLVIEVETEGVHIFLVHLALRKKIRAEQLLFLADIVNPDKPTIVAGDFNTFSGPGELDDFCEKLKLVNPNRNYSTYPSWAPNWQLDHVLCSKHIKIKKFTVPKVKFSDHLPIIMDFTISK
ncbi:MAG: hypothetical protein A2020_13315 [Lentisphaerae bacterium GWF2_45_14]|nr:MAG: hypothetical protein A2020_13315 [Lentisphaerae bacterium GWF2_45_14]